MGISADLIILKKYDKNEKIRMDEYVTVFNLEHNYCQNIITEMKEKYGNDITHLKELILLYIGDGNVFKKGILSDYDNNLGVLKFKDNYHFIKDTRLEEIKLELVNIFKQDFETILKNDNLYINLNY